MMIFLTIFTFFLALVSASVISKVPGRSPFAQLSTRQSINDCDVGYYEDRTDDKSPFIADCETLITKLKHGTCYLILNGEYKQIAQYKSCAVGIVSADCENSHSFVMHPSLLPPLRSAVQGPLADTQRSLFRAVPSICTRLRLETRTSPA